MLTFPFDEEQQWKDAQKVEDEILNIWVATGLDIKSIIEDLDLVDENLEVLMLALMTLTDKRFERLLDIYRGIYYDRRKDNK
jgi:hypothetical protein